MSFTLVAKVMGLKIGSLPRKMVLLKLADQANDNGLCWPSYQTIAEACEISRRSVIRHIQQLETDGYLTITKTYDKENQKNFSNKYNLTLDRGDKLSLVTGKTSSSDSVTLPSDTVTPEPIIEPIINQPREERSQKIEGDVLAVRDNNTESISNWQPPSKETMQAQLMMAGKKLDMTDNQYLSHVGDFKAYYEEQAANGKPIKRENLRQSKLKNWLASIADRQPKQAADTVARPHSNRSDAFSQTNEPRLTRQQQIEKNRQAMIEAGLQA